MLSKLLPHPSSWPTKAQWWGEAHPRVGVLLITREVGACHAGWCFGSSAVTCLLTRFKMAPVAFTRPFPGHHARSRVPGPPLPRCCHPNLGSLLRTSMMEGCDRGLWPACVPGSSICGELSLSVCCPLDTEQEPSRGRGRWEVRAKCSLPTPLQPVACGHRPEALEGFPAGLPAGPQALAQGPRPEGGGKEAVHAEEGRCSGHADPWLQQSQRQGGPPGAGPPRMQPSVPGPLALLDATGEWGASTPVVPGRPWTAVLGWGHGQGPLAFLQPRDFTCRALCPDTVGSLHSPHSMSPVTTDPASASLVPA